MIEKNNCCVSCGRIIPEGYQVCYSCWKDDEQARILAQNARMRENRRKHKNTNPHKLREIWHEFIDKISLLSIKPRQKNK